LANLRAYLGFMWAHPGKQLLFMGCELAQDAEWSEERSIDWELLADPGHQGVQDLVRDLNRVYREQPALWEQDSVPEGFAWIDANDVDHKRVLVHPVEPGARAAGLPVQLLAGRRRALPGWAAPRRPLG
jgi:1,4-alpha-glucan branching enzyme